MKTQILLGLIALGSLLNTACSVETMDSSQVTPQGTYQSYSVTYDAASDSTQYYAQFRAGGFSGTTLSLSSPAQVAANSSKMSSSWMLGTYYSRTVSGFQPDARFEWTDNQQKVYVNNTSMKPVAIKTAAATISGLVVYEVEIEALSLANNEEVRVSLYQEHQGETQKEILSANAVYNRNTHKATFSPVELAKLRNGNAVLNVSRSTSKSLQQSPNNKGVISATYNAVPMNVMIMNLAPAAVSLAGR